jgi:hypothetical protein
MRKILVAFLVFVVPVATSFLQLNRSLVAEIDRGKPTTSCPEVDRYLASQPRELAPGIMWVGEAEVTAPANLDLALGQIEVIPLSTNSHLWGVFYINLKMSSDLPCNMMLALAKKELYGNATAHSWYLYNQDFFGEDSQVMYAFIDGAGALVVFDELKDAGYYPDVFANDERKWDGISFPTCTHLSTIHTFIVTKAIRENDPAVGERLLALGGCL